MRVSEALEVHPLALDIFLKYGFAPLRNPVMEFAGNQFSISFLRVQELVHHSLFHLQELSRPPVRGFRCL